jgi:uncharacterized protein
MQERRYRLIFNGQISFEYDTFEVKKNICMLFNTDPSEVESYFTGITVSLKESLTRDEADRLKKVFDGTGGVAVIEVMENVVVSPPTPPPRPVTINSGPFACPKCGAVQSRAESCFNCGVIFNKIQQPGQPKPLELQPVAVENRQNPEEPLAEETTINPREKEARQWAMICHLSGLSGCIIPLLIIPFGNIVGPLVIWHLKKDQSKFVREHGIIALNFQIPMTVLILCFWIMRLLVHSNLVLIPAGIFMLYSMVMVVWASLKASKGELIRIPLSRTIIS